MPDVLTRAQLEQQAQRRRLFLESLKKNCADEKIIAAAEKDLKLTERRLERMLNADYEESIESITQIGG